MRRVTTASSRRRRRACVDRAGVVMSRQYSTIIHSDQLRYHQNGTHTSMSTSVAIRFPSEHSRNGTHMATQRLLAETLHGYEPLPWQTTAISRSAT